MAEASTVAETPNGGSVPQPRFYCHRCNVEIPRVLPGFKCPRCNSGFIEELELQPQPQQSFSDESSDEGDVEMVTSIGELLSQSLFNIRDSTTPSAEAGGASSGSSETGESNPTTRRRRQAAGTFLPVRSTRRRTSSDRQMAPLENIIQEFIINLSGFDFDPAVMQAQGSPMFMYGNPGDYAFGRAGLDAIITQLLNQMDGTGPPPMAKDRIAQIPTVTVEQHQVDENLQCSVCWEDFKLAEPVRKLVCDHFYHTQCIVPWLQLHGTCPICRKALNDETNPNHESSSSAPGPSTSSSSSNSSNSGGGGASWLSNATQSGPRLISSFIGSLTNALSGGGSSSSPSSSSSSSSSASSSSQQQNQSGREGESPSSPMSSSRRHPYNLRSHREPRAGNDEEEDSSAQSQRYGFPGPGTGNSRGRGRGHHNFEDDYD